jgi:hypothetical protein
MAQGCTDDEALAIVLIHIYPSVIGILAYHTDRCTDATLASNYDLATKPTVPQEAHWAHATFHAPPELLSILYKRNTVLCKCNTISTYITDSTGSSLDSEDPPARGRRFFRCRAVPGCQEERKAAAKKKAGGV